MKNVGVIPNLDKDMGLIKTKEIIQWLINHNCNPIVTEQIFEKINLPCIQEDIETIYKDSDFLLVLGGDGTILRASRKAAMYDTPILGVNLGTLGYLTDVEPGNVYQALENVLDGNFKKERRMMLEASTSALGIENETHIALNDFSLTRGIFSKTISIELHINDEYIDTYRADGIIVATPTGSTAYSLSAGGPILKPDVEMMVITPISPHMIYARPIVVSANDTVRLILGDKPLNDSVVAMDGQSLTSVKSGNTIIIKRSKYYATTIKTNNKGFFDILRTKMVVRSL